MPAHLTAHSTDRLYTVGQLAAELGVSARTLRFYEDKGLITPQRAGSTRVYTHRDRARMIIILRGKQLGFSLREVQEYLDLYRGDRDAEQQQALLAGVRRRIALLHEQRQALDHTLTELEELERQVAATLPAEGSPEKDAA